MIHFGICQKGTITVSCCEQENVNMKKIITYESSIFENGNNLFSITTIPSSWYNKL